MKRIKIKGFTPSITRTELYLYYFALNNKVSRVPPKIDLKFEITRTPPPLECVQQSTIAHRLRDGDEVAVAYSGRKPVGYVFIAHHKNWVEEIHDMLYLDNKEIYLYDAYTYKTFRGNYIYPALLTDSAQHYKRLSYRNALIFTTGDNIPSQKSIVRAGFNQYGCVRFSNLLGLKTWDYRKRNNGIYSHFKNEN